jgi:non-ribosomal peptide synthetase component F
MPTPYDIDLDRNPANFQPLTPLSFLARAAEVYPDATAIIHGARSWNYRQFDARAKQLASALARRGIKRGDTVSVMLANTPALVEAHYGVPMAGAVLNALNTRLDAALIAFILDHADAKVLITDREFSKIIKEALARAEVKPLVVDYDDPEFTGAGERLGSLEYEEFLREGDADFAWQMPDDEWDAISLNYTSGTTGDPKGVVYHHRGAYLLALGNVITCGMGKHPGLSVDAADVPLQRLVLSLDAVGRRRHPCLPARGARGADLRRHRHAQGDASVRGAHRDVDVAQCAAAGEEISAACGRVRHCRRAAAGSRAWGDEGRRLQRHPCLRPDRGLRAGVRQ